jgi:hypothetical protein
MDASNFYNMFLSSSAFNKIVLGNTKNNPGTETKYSTSFQFAP